MENIAIITQNEDGTETTEVVKVHVVKNVADLEALFTSVANAETEVN